MPEKVANMPDNKFTTAIKRKLLPDFVGGGVPQIPGVGQNQPQGASPQAAMSGDRAIRLGLGEILAPGGTQHVADISNSYWFSALQPIRPLAPVAYRPRQRAFLPGENLIWTPGEDKDGITFENLRFLADSWDLLRIIIETRKDQICAVPWEVRPKTQPGETKKQWKERTAGDPNVKALTDFFNFPDGFHSWRTWIRMWFEDMLVIDGVALYYQRDEEGKIASVMPLDAATINRCLTDQGVTPPPPSVAYQQVVYGTPACDMTTDDLIYAMRNERNHRRYGYSPVEQILVTIGIGLRKQMFLTEYYTSGNMPEALCFLPAQLPPERISEIQDWFDSIMAGDLQKRRRLTFLPGFSSGASGGSGNVSPNVVFPKETLLKDELDEWLMRIVCYAFSVSPQNLMKQMNRASAEQASTVAEEEGLEPAMTFVADIHNQIIRDLGFGDDYEWGFQERRDTDAQKQATIDNLLVGKIYTINEIREARGDDPRPEAEADMLGVFTATGFVPIDQPPAPAMGGFGSGSSEGEGGEQPPTASQEKESGEGGKPPQKEEASAATQKGLLVGSPAQNRAISESRLSRKFTKIVGIGDRRSDESLYSRDYGNLAQYAKFLAFDAQNNALLVKGDVNIKEAVADLRKKDPERTRMILLEDE